MYNTQSLFLICVQSTPFNVALDFLGDSPSNNSPFILPGGAFVPRPDVDVGVVRMTPLRKPYISVSEGITNLLVWAHLSGFFCKKRVDSLLVNVCIFLSSTLNNCHWEINWGGNLWSLKDIKEQISSPVGNFSEWNWVKSGHTQSSLIWG